MIRPQDDFYHYINNKWLKKTKLPKKYSRYGTFEIIQEKTQKQLLNLIKNKSTGKFNKIKTLYNEFMNRGALGGKLLGAGGGGFFLFYIPHHMQNKIISKFKKLITIPFNFTSDGSKIILNKKNKK